MVTPNRQPDSSGTQRSWLALSSASDQKTIIHWQLVKKVHLQKTNEVSLPEFEKHTIESGKTMERAKERKRERPNEKLREKKRINQSDSLSDDGDNRKKLCAPKH